MRSAETAQDFLEGNVLAPVYSTASGDPIAIGVRIGADSLVANASDNCDDWSTSSASAFHDMAESSVAGSSPFYYATFECSVSFWNVLCLEP